MATTPAIVKLFRVFPLSLRERAGVRGENPHESSFRHFTMFKVLKTENS
jgi:hypothetical protein